MAKKKNSKKGGGATKILKENAEEMPENVGRGEMVIDPKLVEEIKKQMDKNNGIFAIEQDKVHKIFNWKKGTDRAYGLKRKLNKQYPTEDGTERQVGKVDKTKYYFTIRDKKSKKSEE